MVIFYTQLHIFQEKIYFYHKSVSALFCHTITVSISVIHSVSIHFCHTIIECPFLSYAQWVSLSAIHSVSVRFCHTVSECPFLSYSHSMSVHFCHTLSEYFCHSQWVFISAIQSLNDLTVTISNTPILCPGAIAKSAKRK